MSNLKIEYVPKVSLKAYCNNAKIHTDEQIEQIRHSIEEFGFNDPIALWRDNEIIEGHGRLLAVMDMDEIETVPVIRLDNLTDEQRRAYMLVHNKLTMNTDFDIEILETELDDISDIDMEVYGFDYEAEPITEGDEDEALFEDVDKLDKHYGVPYQGNKSRIADIIISILPEGERLVDLFGGVARSHIAQCFRASGIATSTTI